MLVEVVVNVNVEIDVECSRCSAVSSCRRHSSAMM